MSGDVLGVDPSELGVASAALAGQADTADRSVEQLVRAMTDLVSTAWQGEAANAFLEALASWQKRGEALSGQLRQLSSDLAFAQRTYGIGHTSVQQVWSG